MQVNDENVVFNVFDAMKYQNYAVDHYNAICKHFEVKLFEEKKEAEEEEECEEEHQFVSTNYQRKLKPLNIDERALPAHIPLLEKGSCVELNPLPVQQQYIFLQKEEALPS